MLSITIWQKKLELPNFFSISKLLNLNFHCQKLLRCKCTFPIFFCLCKIFGDLRRHLSLISNEKMSNLTSKATLLKYRLLCPPWLLCDKIAVNFEHWEASFHPFHLFFPTFLSWVFFNFYQMLIKQKCQKEILPNSKIQFKKIFWLFLLKFESLVSFSSILALWGPKIKIWKNSIKIDFLLIFFW